MTEGGAALREEMSRLLADWSAAICANDAEAIGRFAAPEWELVGENGRTPRDAFLGAVASGDLTHSTMRHDVEQAACYGDVCVVVARVVNDGTWQGTPFHADEWTSDVFVRGEDGWRCVLTHLTTRRG
jgi:ketosteroid isomerase-like protein